MGERRILSNPIEFKRHQREILEMFRAYGYKDAKVIEGTPPVRKLEDKELLIIK